MTEIFIGVASFLGGSFLTAIMFIVSNSNKIALLISDVGQLKMDVKEIKDRPLAVCAAHQALVEHAAFNTQRIEKLEIPWQGQERRKTARVD